MGDSVNPLVTIESNVEETMRELYLDIPFKLMVMKRHIPSPDIKAMLYFVGASGFSYDHWSRPTVYPQRLKAGRRLTYYSQFFQTVEINNTLGIELKPDQLNLPGYQPLAFS